MAQCKWLTLALLWWVSGCSNNQKVSSVSQAAVNQAAKRRRKSFILTEAYSSKYCFLHQYWWKDSLANVRDICQAKGVAYDTLNQVRIERHSWQSGYCRINAFLLVSQGEKLWFIPFCDELHLDRRDTAFVKNNLAITQPLNKTLSELALKDRQAFLKLLLDVLFVGRNPMRIGSAEDVRGADNKLISYVRQNVGRPQTYFYHSLQGLHPYSIWEFRDFEARGVQVRIIRPGEYRCFAL